MFFISIIIIFEVVEISSFRTNSLRSILAWLSKHVPLRQEELSETMSENASGKRYVLV